MTHLWVMGDPKWIAKESQNNKLLPAENSQLDCLSVIFSVA